MESTKRPKGATQFLAPFYALGRFILMVMAVMCLLSLLLVPIIVSSLYPERFEDTGVVISLLAFNGLRSTVLMMVLFAGLSIAFIVNTNKPHRHHSDKNRKYLWLKQAIVFVAVMAGGAAMLNMPLPILFAITAMIVYSIYFPIGQVLKDNKGGQGLFIALALATYIAGLVLAAVLFFISQKAEKVVIDGPCSVTWGGFFEDLWWVGTVLIVWLLGLVYLAWRIGKPFAKGKPAVLFALRLGACAIVIPIIASAFFSGRSVQMSPEASLIFKQENLYDIHLDSAKGRLLVSQTNPDECQPEPYSYLFAFSLDDLNLPPTKFRLPTIELEDLAFDPDSRQIYQVNLGTLEIGRSTFKTLVFDADTLKLKRELEIDVVCNGSINHALIKSLDRLFVRCDVDNMVVINTQTLQADNLFFIGKLTMILGDPTNEIVYLSYDWKKVIEAIDATTLKVIHRAKGPLYAEKMLLSSRRNELYVPGPKEAEIWVFSAPDLNLIRKIPARFGVRALAIDEENNLLIAGSYVTGYVDVVDLNTYKPIKTYYVGKFQRSMVVDSSSRQAFITTTKSGLYMLQY